jgi:hypothetical protein
MLWSGRQQAKYLSEAYAAMLQGAMLWLTKWSRTARVGRSEYLFDSLRLAAMVPSKHAGFGIAAENFAEGIADFAHSGVGANSIQDKRHGVFRTLGRAPEGV